MVPKRDVSAQMLAVDFPDIALLHLAVHNLAFPVLIAQLSLVPPTVFK